ncbi:hypothetical protein M231_04598 [Tremella mesenterica]|uniref:Uncharacterized protein n=1 Tax=Tremella mesenterica TaxID=5217 RepID=A0A4V1M3V0_TREME|nr:hypothetical protein M231_04598 [Tremella mesenterica]
MSSIYLRQPYPQVNPHMTQKSTTQSPDTTHFGSSSVELPYGRFSHDYSDSIGRRTMNQQCDGCPDCTRHSYSTYPSTSFPTYYSPTQGSDNSITSENPHTDTGYTSSPPLNFTQQVNTFTTSNYPPHVIQIPSWSRPSTPTSPSPHQPSPRSSPRILSLNTLPEPSPSPGAVTVIRLLSAEPNMMDPTHISRKRKPVTDNTRSHHVSHPFVDTLSQVGGTLLNYPPTPSQFQQDKVLPRFEERISYVDNNLQTSQRTSTPGTSLDPITTSTTLTEHPRAIRLGSVGHEQVERYLSYRPHKK